MTLVLLCSLGNLGIYSNCAHVFEVAQTLLCKITCLGSSVSYLHMFSPPPQQIFYKIAFVLGPVFRTGALLGLLT